MLRLLQFLWTGCFHEWETFKQINVFESPNSKWPCNTDYHLRCKKCGNVKRRRL